MKVNKRIISMLVGALMIGSIAVGCEKKEEIKNDTQVEQTQATEVEEEKEETKEVSKVVYDKDDIKITYVGMEKNDELVPATVVKFKIENNRDEDVTVQSDVNNTDSEITLNDSTKIGYSFCEELKANETKDFGFAFADEADLKDNGIDEIEKLEVGVMVLHNEYNVLSEGTSLKLDLTDK